jgi:hypothetical protein
MSGAAEPSGALNYEVNQGIAKTSSAFDLLSLSRTSIALITFLASSEI